MNDSVIMNGYFGITYISEKINDLFI